MTTGTRSHRDHGELIRKRSRLAEPQVAPLTDFVRQLRLEIGHDDVPWFDPAEAGINARILLLLEAPGRRATAAKGSGFISPDNDDATAHNMWHLLRDAAVDRTSEVVIWNIVPWYIGQPDHARIRSATVADLDKARPYLEKLLSLLPDVRVVVLLGRKAAHGWHRASISPAVAVLKAPHPSPRWLNTHPEARPMILRALVDARRLAGLTPRPP